jgi:glycosyltransferase involved in cell wall biosynthesis
VAARVLLTVSGTIPGGLKEAVDEGQRPRVDYLELAAGLDAELLDHARAAAEAGRVARVLRHVGGDGIADGVALAAACFRRRRHHEVVFTDSERVGMLYALMTWFSRGNPRHVMIGHRLSAGKKVLTHRLLGLRRRIDHVVVYSSRQRDLAVDQLGYRPDQVTVMPFMVDTAFWRPEQVAVTERSRPMICSAGQELRDYPTLVAAVRDLDLDVVLAAASPWSKRADTSAGLEIPANISVTRLTPFDLRQLYADATIVVVPIEETDFQAGITTILEGMSMSRAIVCTRTEGQTDTIVDGETGLYVPPGDVAALRAAVTRLLADPALADRLAAAGRDWVVEHADIDRYVRRFQELVGSG